jgi:hypothetical protein
MNNCGMWMPWLNLITEDELELARVLLFQVREYFFCELVEELARKWTLQELITLKGSTENYSVV